MDLDLCISTALLILPSELWSLPEVRWEFFHRNRKKDTVLGSLPVGVSRYIIFKFYFIFQ